MSRVDTYARIHQFMSGRQIVRYIAGFFAIFQANRVVTSAGAGDICFHNILYLPLRKREKKSKKFGTYRINHGTATQRRCTHLNKYFLRFGATVYTLFLGVNREEVMMGGNPDGIDKVEDSDGGYAFFMESSIITYLIERRCKLAQVEYKTRTKIYL